MKSFAFAAVASVAAAISTDKLEFLNYTARFNKVYEEIEEFALRYERFVHWHMIINDHNATNGENFNLGHNQFSDWTDAEYEAILGYYTVGSDENRHSQNKVIDSDVSVWPFLPKNVNWVDKGGVTKVKDQTHCGACWAFAAIGALEGAHFAQSGELLSLSEQQLIDCPKRQYGTMGCQGGDYQNAFMYFADYSPTLESDYPFTSASKDAPQTDCLFSASKATKIQVKEFHYIYSDKPTQSMKARVHKQPIVVAVAANNKFIHSYLNGVIDATECYDRELKDPLNPVNHAVLVVGYGHDEATDLDYWLVKNSWNATWGDNGYVKIAMDDADYSNGVCGINMYTAYPVLN